MAEGEDGPSQFNQAHHLLRTHHYGTKWYKSGGTDDFVDLGDFVGVGDVAILAV
jgi:hypothetical protein